MKRLLSGDLPRSRVLAVILVLVFLGLAAAPFICPGTRSLNVAAKVAVFILLVALVANYTGFLAPKVALGSNILLMVLILMWRPQGLYPVAKR